MRTIRYLRSDIRVVPAELVSIDLVSDIIIIRTTPQVPDLPVLCNNR